jgi:hypothetical protein
MTRVHGRIFADQRDGVLVIKPSKPFFGVDKYERHYPVTAGEIDIELQPTPRGYYYNVGFKEEGDIRDTAFTLKWKVPATGEVDVTPGQDKPEEVTNPSNALTEVSNRRLATELAEALAAKTDLEFQVEELQLTNQELKDKVYELERATEFALGVRDKELAELRTANAPVVKTVYQRVPVPPEPLKERISFLEAENQRLADLNDTYYKAVLELNQLKLDRAQTVHLPQTVEEIPDNPRQRLIQKLKAK